MELQDRVAIVTGAGGGIGYAISCRLAAAGAKVVVTDVDEAKLQVTADAVCRFGNSVLPLIMDVTDSDSVKNAVARTVEEFGRIDILINNAGGSAALRKELTMFKDAREEIWQWVIALNLHGTMRCTREVLPIMTARQYGRIINMSSIAAEVGILQRCDYAAAKAGIIGFSKTLAMEVGKDGITVNCVAPGLISRTHDIQPDAPELKSEGNYLGRVGTPDEIANAVLFFAKEESGYITGTNLTVDGGRVLGPKTQHIA